jgi:ABC-type glycerol-3-phosphate transport system permease component
MRVDGASRLGIMTRLLIPLSTSTIVTVVVFVVIQVWSEVLLAATLINSQGLYTLPVLAALGVGGTGALSATWVSLAPPLAVFLASQRTFRRGMLAGELL